MEKQGVVAEEAQRLLDAFLGLGAVAFHTDILQPAETLLDLYGEDIRGRAFVTQDSSHNELMLRPDFTVPLAKFHMESEVEFSRYAYAGPVFRRQVENQTRPAEYLQVGYEMFGGNNRAEDDAQIFAAFYEILSPLGLEAATGDMSLLIAAVNGLTATQEQKAALKRHLWRPRRFRNLLEFYSKPVKNRSYIEDVNEIKTHVIANGSVIGHRSLEEVIERVQAKQDEATLATLCKIEVEAIEELLNTEGTMQQALQGLRSIILRLPSIGKAVDGLIARMEAFSRLGIPTESLRFEASFGRTVMEYYDGFIFGFASNGDDLPAALGGRYDHLTKVLGGGRSCPAVGGIIKPELTARLRGAA